MARFDYDDYEKRKTTKSSTSTNKQSRFGFFSLKNDGDEAVVKFVYNSEDEFDLVNLHVLKIDDKYRKIHCLREPFESIDKCPLCKAEEKATVKFFVKLIEYTLAEDGTIVATPKVWERSLSFAKLLKSYFKEYGTVNEHIFKIKRHGAKGDQGTTYDVMFANPKIFKPEMYVNNPDAFKDLDIVKILVSDKDESEMEEYLTTGSFPTITAPSVPPTTSTSSSPVQKDIIVVTNETSSFPTHTPKTTITAEDTSQPQRPIRRKYDID